MAQRSIRFSDELEARIEAVAKADDRSFGYVVRRAVEKDLEGNPYTARKRGLESALSAQTKAPELSEPTGASPSAASTRAPAEKKQPGPKVAPREPAAATVKKPDSRRTPSLKDTWGR